jgi:PadR family transcriptional regulator PadR
MTATPPRKAPDSDRERKKGTADLLVLSLLEERDRHGYELAKLIENRSDGVLHFHVASLYTLLRRIEERGWIKGRWVEKAGERRRRFYRLTAAGRSRLAGERARWAEFVNAVGRVTQLGEEPLEEA